ncbi:hypothetical protein HMSSN139_44890 [Paenibacillus sp. HMSSN-139]|nr:hypothetical protein HMSSN139_44890 [Paenibacillus sp. HMSSN-139]
MDNKKIMPQWISTALAIGMLGTTLLACSNGGQAGSANQNEGGANSGGNAPVTEATTYPIQTDETLTYWGELTGNLVGVKTRTKTFLFSKNGRRIRGCRLSF